MSRRRHRLFLFFAVVIVILLYRTLQNSWDVPQQRHPEGSVSTVSTEENENPSTADHVVRKLDDVDHGDAQKPVQQGEVASKDSEKGAFSFDDAQTQQANLGLGAMPDIAGTKTLNDHQAEIPIHNGPDQKTSTADTQPTKVHWTKPRENFPLPKESVITLPTAPAKKMPRIQHVFSPEAEGPKKKRLQRQAAVKEAIQRSWTGYKKHAWMHDELSPVSNGTRDPFCGWSATLIDSLDTLWIAGMKDEFDEAAKAAKMVDFTFANRPNIPVFETTIRYLGGLIAAYDVSGGASGGYSFLLDKAVELAEVLMGVFDTPNRMPILSYQWGPEFTSEPRRAVRAGMAELATLSLEFTRLAQLTAQHKYYDAVDRITNGLVELQKQGTTIPGLFPENIDISGCNRTATDRRNAMSKAARAQVDSEDVTTPPQGYNSRDDAELVSRLGRRAPPPSRQNNADADADVDMDAAPSAGNKPRTAQTSTTSFQIPLGADGGESEWDCVPQGFAPVGFGYESYHMGGGQDSAYEYFAKEYLLLGGREPKYQKLYEDTTDSTNKYLMYRPMVQGDWDIIFPARVEVKPRGLRPDVGYEVTHLTCFIGGMYALGGKLFGREKDLEYAKKLTDGCVWAYQSTASGIMPENAQLVPCPTFEKCSFNESVWHYHLDPMAETRDEQALAWEKSELERERLYKQEIEREGAPVEMAKEAEHLRISDEDVDDSSSQRQLSESVSSSAAASSDEPRLLDKRAPISVEPENVAFMSEDGTSTHTPADRDTTPNGNTKSAQKTKTPTADFTTSSNEAKPTDGASIKIPTLKEEYHSRPKPPHIPENRPFMSGRTYKPPTHKEYVQSQIANGLPPGFKSVSSRNYILRPEAIESVWYMYRITGDASWMDKGWTMFEATIKATRAPQAYSAIDNVLVEKPTLSNAMESFWLAETLKYYYLLFSDPDVISLDEWVLNTEAHPFRL